MIVVVEGPSAAGKTTWCRRHAPQFMPEPGRWPTDRTPQYQIDRWRKAVTEDQRDRVLVLAGDLCKLYYSWASRRVGALSEGEWKALVETTRRHFVAGDYGLADLVLYNDPGEDELRQRKEGDQTRSRRNFDLHSSMRPYFQQWYEAVSRLDPQRVVWEHPADGLIHELLAVGPRNSRSDPALFDGLLALLPTAS